MPGPDAPLAALEALIFSGGGGPAALRRVLGLTPGQIAAGVQEINSALEKSGRPYEIVEVAGGYQFRTRPEYGELLASAQPERKVKLSRASLDSLAVIAYRQPISRPEVEEIRSVDCGAVIKSLLERDLIRIVGRRDAPGRPVLYGTTACFLETFGLSSLRDLPDLRDLLPSSAVEATPIEAAIAQAERTADMAEDDALESLEPRAEDASVQATFEPSDATDAEPVDSDEDPEDPDPLELDPAEHEHVFEASDPDTEALAESDGAMVQALASHVASHTEPDEPAISPSGDEVDARQDDDLSEELFDSPPVPTAVPEPSLEMHADTPEAAADAASEIDVDDRTK